MEQSACSTYKVWPGKVIPTLKGPKCKDNDILLDKLVVVLLPHCLFNPPTLCAVTFR